MSDTAPANAATPRPALRLRISPAAEGHVRSGHPWVYLNSIRDTNRRGETGEFAIIYDRNDRFLAIGLFDADSPIQVRILHQGKPAKIDDAWWENALNQALERRRGLFDEQTTGWRVINGESDHFPALVLDRYGETLVLKLYSLIWLPRLAMIRDLIQRTLQPQRLVLRLSRNVQALYRTAARLEDGQVLSGPPVAELPTFLESGLRFEADVVRGQKTGFFLDQRDNRRRVGELTAGRDVLNAFSFSGGFSLHAARGGAKSVTDLDISAHALESSRRNFALNHSLAPVAACRHECIQADVFEWLAQKPARQFGLVVIDPPSLARREEERTGAITAYRRLNADGIRWLKPGGILLAGSCSAHVSTEEFYEAVRSAARASGRRFTELETNTHPADHPATFPEARYLKGIYLRF